MKVVRHSTYTPLNAHTYDGPVPGAEMEASGNAVRCLHRWTADTSRANCTALTHDVHDRPQPQVTITVEDSFCQ